MQKARRHCHKGSSDRLQAQGFRISFTLLVEVLFTFPSQYSSTIGLTGVFSLAGWSRRIRAGFLVSRATQDAAMPAQASGTGLSPPAARLSSRFPSPLPCNTAVLQPPACVATRRVWAPPRSLAATGGIIGLFSFPPGTKMFQFPGLALPHPAEVPVLQTGGLSHSEIRGSTVTCTYPRLVAACHVLRRLREPRHPPCALNYFLAVAACPGVRPGGEGGRGKKPVTRSTHRPFRRNAAAHTFSCSVRSRPVRNIPQGGRTVLGCQLYSLACVNMSKIGAECRGVENNGFEPLTPCLQSRCSSQLS